MQRMRPVYYIGLFCVCVVVNRESTRVSRWVFLHRCEFTWGKLQCVRTLRIFFYDCNQSAAHLNPYLSWENFQCELPTGANIAQSNFRFNVFFFQLYTCKWAGDNYKMYVNCWMEVERIDLWLGIGIAVEQNQHHMKSWWHWRRIFSGSFKCETYMK